MQHKHALVAGSAVALMAGMISAPLNPALADTDPSTVTFTGKTSGATAPLDPCFWDAQEVSGFVGDSISMPSDCLNESAGEQVLPYSLTVEDPTGGSTTSPTATEHTYTFSSSGTYTITAQNDQSFKVTIAAPAQSLQTVCTSEEAEPGDDLFCTVTGGFVDGSVRLVDQDQVVLASTPTSAGDSEHQLRWTMPDSDVTLVAQALNSGGGIVATSSSVSVTADTNANLKWSCSDVVLRPGQEFMCTADSATNNGTELSVDINGVAKGYDLTFPWAPKYVTVTAPEAEGSYSVRATLRNFDNTVLDVADVSVRVSENPNPGPDDKTLPPPLEFAVPVMEGEPCPDGWGESWQEWAQGPVCVTTDNFDGSKNEYERSYSTIENEVARYEDEAIEDAQAARRAGGVARVNGVDYSVLNSQKVFYLDGRDTGLDSRDRQIVERIIGGLQNDPTAIVEVSGFAPNAKLRNLRIDGIDWMLTSRGISPDRIVITDGDPSASRSQNRVDFLLLSPLGDGPRVTEVAP